jgi:hypothetical protein
MPWSKAFRTTWRRESLKPSTIHLSSSVSAPCSSRRTHDARQLLEHLPQRHHASVEDALLQLLQLSLDGPVQLLGVRRERFRPLHVHQAFHDRGKRSALDSELTDQVHELIELADLDTNRAADRTERLDLDSVARSLAHSRRRDRGRTATALARRRFSRARGTRISGLVDHARRRGHGFDLSQEIACREIARDQQAESDLRFGCGAGGRERREHLTHFGHVPRQLREALVEREHLEGALHHRDPTPAANVLAQPMLLVLRECAQHRRLEVELIERELVRRTHSGDARADARDQIRFARRAEASVRLVFAIETLHRGGNRPDEVLEQRGRRAVHRYPAQPHRIEQLLEVMRKLRERLETEHPREALERMRRAKQAVHRVGADRVGPLLIREVGEVLSQAFEDLLRLRHEVAICLAALPRSGASGRHGALRSSRAVCRRPVCQIERVGDDPVERIARPAARRLESSRGRVLLDRLTELIPRGRKDLLHRLGFLDDPDAPHVFSGPISPAKSAR